MSKSLFLQHATVEVYYSMFFITNFIIFLIQVFHLILGSLISISSLSHSLLLLLLSLVHTPTDIIANFWFFFFLVVLIDGGWVDFGWWVCGFFYAFPSCKLKFSSKCVEGLGKQTYINV